MRFDYPSKGVEVDWDGCCLVGFVEFSVGGSIIELGGAPS